MDSLLRTILTVLGVILFAGGVLWALQGAGVVMWPASSFMLKDQHWVIYGILTADFGLLQIFLARR